jgi:hypothetical protein
MPKSDREWRGRPTPLSSENGRGSAETSEAARATSQRRGASSFEARYGRVILEHGIAAIPAGLFHFQRLMGLDAKHLWFIAYILSCKWDADLPYPSLNKMERCTGVDIQALYRYKRALVRQGYLQVFRRLTDKGGYDTDAYDFSGLFDCLEDCIMAEKPEPNPIRADNLDTSHSGISAVPVGAGGQGSAPGPGAQVGEFDSSFVARYGRVIVRYGVAAIPRGVFTFQNALKLTPQQVWFVGYILSFKWDAALPYPSIEKMALNTGYNRAYLHEIKASLVSAGYLKLVHRTNSQGGQDTNAYDFSGLLDGIRAQLDAEKAGAQSPTALQSLPSALQTSPGPEPALLPAALHFIEAQEAHRAGRFTEPPARARSRAAAQTRARVASDTIQLATNSIPQDNTAHSHPAAKSEVQGAQGKGKGKVGLEPGINRAIGVGINEHTPPGITENRGPAISTYTPSGINGATEVAINRHTLTGTTEQTGDSRTKQTGSLRQVRGAHPASSTRGQVSRRRHESETVQTEELKRFDSNQISDLQNSEETQLPAQDADEKILYSPYVASVVADFSNDLGDPEHVVSNVTQALRIYSRSGLSEQEFSTLLFEARNTVRSYQGKQGVRGINNKMAYFFTTLRRLAIKSPFQNLFSE